MFVSLVILPCMYGLVCVVVVVDSAHKGVSYKSNMAARSAQALTTSAQSSEKPLL